MSTGIKEIVLLPGEFHFGDANTRIRTLLGSCVSITLWHPEKLIGGMCHYMLPFREGSLSRELDGRYADEAMQMFMHEIKASGTHPSEYRVKAFGGGNMFPYLKKKNAQKCGIHTNREEIRSCRDVSCKNAHIAKSVVAAHGLTLAAEDLGGDGHRNVIFDIRSGHVWVRQVKASRLSETGVLLEKN
ncbi:MAG: chemotaxis protein CheD [Burkholderiales bacterium]